MGATRQSQSLKDGRTVMNNALSFAVLAKEEPYDSGQLTLTCKIRIRVRVSSAGLTYDQPASSFWPDQMRSSLVVGGDICMKSMICVGVCCALISPVRASGLMLTSFYNPHTPDTAAHRTLPFGTKLRLTNPRNGHSVTVTINDRGPFVRGRSLDISRAYAERLGIVRDGVAALDVAPAN
jgi:Lytic transglycolase